ncbi:transcription termination factor NusA [Actinomyces sp.]|uniref:transcription termination factor NusA n=1 Tax=Actinomyces sp. TaxID=29317 RepID=UPI0037BEB99B
MEIDMRTLREVGASLEIDGDTLVAAIEEALLKVYHKMPGAMDQARIEIDQRTGKVAVMATELDEEDNPIGEFDDTPKEFGRIATATARSVIAQRLREAEDSKVLGDFRSRTGSVVVGTVEAQRNPAFVMLRVGEFEARLPQSEQVPGEVYNHGDVLRAYVVDVSRGEKGAAITVSRTHPGLVEGLFEREVPEIQQGLVQIKSVAREAGHRTKIAVAATREGVNAKGACIGPMGRRVRAVMTELQGEKIDIVDYSSDPARFVANSLSPARVSSVTITDLEGKNAEVVVPDFQFSLAIGREGQNARLAARLCGFHIDIHSDTEAGLGVMTGDISRPDVRQGSENIEPTD